VTTLARLLHLDDGEFPALRAQIEAKPLPTPPAKKPVGWGRAMLDHLNAEAPVERRTLGLRRPSAPIPPRPIVLTDWSARLADDWTHLASRWDNLAAATVREYDRLHLGAEYEVHAWFAPILSELTELTTVQLPEWRKALRVHAEAELALYDAKAGVA
jgi:hypothetical protein